MPTVVGIGSLVWTVAAVVLLVVRGAGTGFVVCVVGAVLGGVGYGVFRWQRAAARRGSPTAQQGLR
jgi:hypothetical protein